MKDKVWNALHDAKLGVEYTSLYSLKIKKRRNNYKKMIILIALLGAALFFFWQPAAIIACVLLFVSEVTVNFNNQIVMSDRDLLKLGDLKVRYVQLFNKLERLMIDINDDCLPQEEVNRLYSEILDNRIEIENLQEEISIPKNEAFQHLAKQRTGDYLAEHFGS